MYPEYIKTSLVLAECCLQIPSHPPKCISNVCDTFSFSEHIQAKIGMFIAKIKKTVIICFSCNEIDTRNEVIKTCFKLPAELSIPNECRFSGVKVHPDFRDLFETFKYTIIGNLLRLKPYDKVLLAGHSTAAALVQLCAFDMSYTACSTYKIIPYFECFTFGSPKVGNSKFVKLYDYAIPTSFRYTNKYDIIPRISLGILGYRHTFGELNLPTVQTSITSKHSRIDNVKNFRYHSLLYYMECLTSYFYETNKGKTLEGTKYVWDQINL